MDIAKETISEMRRVREAQELKGKNPCIESEIVEEFRHIINKLSRENTSNTPDFLLARYLYECLVAYENIHEANEKWYGKSLNI